ncbi:hypothetical protein FisN_20Hu223 [Fistulifera solaris]|jgi:hypothetical protein|uniref:Uncharacterized protein n=1 Tax=Fistulifera solaris TaxID=1519565 RepID=A0A1Z5JPZ5_FISSO|nr:hypothetical protein FisN_20Hu223 [Fistulifera solaris]|eukprot:GAX16100.1 hypothetical protein FisN_20Hu223 [Fistulifera solaris]
MEETNESDNVLKRIPEEELTARQRKFIEAGTAQCFTHYELRRDLNRLDEIDWEKYCKIAIWRKNDTVTFTNIEIHTSWRSYQKCVLFYIKDANYSWNGAIFGETDYAVAETATVFWSMKQENDATSFLCIFDNPSEDGIRCRFDFAALRPEQLAQILDSNPTRALTLSTGEWTPEQSAILASRPYPFTLKLHARFDFTDSGTEFVNALEKRHSSFGSLRIDFIAPEWGAPMNHYNLDRLLKLDIFESLGIPDLGRTCVLLPFAAKVKALHCTIRANHVAPDDFKALSIVASDLSVEFIIEEDDEWDELLLSFFGRVSELGHFERLSIGTNYWFRHHLSSEMLEHVTQALIRAIDANPKLSCLDLSTFKELDSDSAIHFENIFRSMGEHEGICTIAVNAFRVDFFWLERQLWRNRNIVVLDSLGNIFSNGSTIDNLYVLNQFYCGSKHLVNESSSERLSLTSSALLKSASNSFQRTALLLADHTDVLCEWIQDLDVDAVGAALASDPVLGDSGRSAPSKRKLQDQDYSLAKKASRDE